MENRATAGEELKEQFKPGYKLVVHWDSKLLPALSHKAPEDRLAVYVSGSGNTKLLGVPKIVSSTGEAQAEAIFQLLKEWNLENQISFMCFDTTASNTGVYKGATVLLQQKLSTKLIGLGCRHHIFELIVAAAWDLIMGPSSGPDIQIFRRFRTNWQFIAADQYEPGIQYSTVKEGIPDVDALMDSLNCKL